MSIKVIIINCQNQRDYLNEQLEIKNEQLEIKNERWLELLEKQEQSQK